MRQSSIRIEFFYSKTCPHCPPIRNMLHEFAKDRGITVEIEEIDAWSQRGEPLAEKYHIQTVPAIVVNGVKRAEGILNRDQFMSAMKEAIR